MKIKACLNCKILVKPGLVDFQQTSGHPLVWPQESIGAPGHSGVIVGGVVPIGWVEQIVVPIPANCNCLHLNLSLVWRTYDIMIWRWTSKSDVGMGSQNYLEMPFFQPKLRNLNATCEHSGYFSFANGLHYYRVLYDQFGWLNWLEQVLIRIW